MSHAYDYEQYANHCLLTLICCALGGWAFGEWMDSTAAGFFAFFALDAINSITLGLAVLAYKPHK